MIPNVPTPLTAVPAFNDALAAFVAGIKARTDARHTDMPDFAPTYSVDRGSKYVRVVATRPGPSRSVFCFVRIADGAVLKAASWKAPAKHARGSIYVNGGMDAVGDYGALYMR